MHTEQNMKRKLRVLALILAPALIFAACDSPTSDTKASAAEEGVRYSVGVNGVIITTDDLIQGVRDALQQSIEKGSANGRDGKTAATPMDVSFGGGNLRLSVEDTVIEIFTSIEDYYVNLDLSGVPGGQFLYYASMESINKAKIQSLTLSQTVGYIKASADTDTNAFDDFLGLKSITAPGVTNVGAYAFYGCTALTTVELPNAEIIGSGAFQGCTALNSVSIPKATTLNSSAFRVCSALPSVSLPKVTTIGGGAFYGCTSLVNLTIPAIQSLGDTVFSTTGGVSLTITMGATPPNLGVNTFNNITADKTVTIKRPSAEASATAYGTSASGENDEVKWANGLRYKGWSNGIYPFVTNPPTARNNITVNIENSDSVIEG